MILRNYKVLSKLTVVTG